MFIVMVGYLIYVDTDSCIKVSSRVSLQSHLGCFSDCIISDA